MNRHDVAAQGNVEFVLIPPHHDERRDAARVSLQGAIRTLPPGATEEEASAFFRAACPFRDRRRRQHFRIWDEEVARALERLFPESASRRRIADVRLLDEELRRVKGFAPMNFYSEKSHCGGNGVSASDPHSPGGFARHEQG